MDGITVVESNTEPAFSLEVMRLSPVWTEEDAALAAEAQNRTGNFVGLDPTHAHEDAYPQGSQR